MTMRILQIAGYTAGNMQMANLRDLHAACKGEGVDMPPWTDLSRVTPAPRGGSD